MDLAPEMLTQKLDKAWTLLEPLWARLYARLAPPLDLHRVAPVLVLGNQKTGSSAIAHLLATASGQSLAANVHPAQGRETELARWDPATMRAFLRHEARYYLSHAIVKENALTTATHSLLAALPRAQGVFIVRRPADNIRSILDRLGLPGTPQPLGPLAATLPEGWREVATGAAQRKRGAGGPPPDPITALARRWSALARIYRRHQARLHLARYEDFMEGKVAFIHRLVEALGLAVQRDIAAQVDVAFQPRGAHRGTPPEVFFSQEALRIIEAICTEEAHALGYSSAIRAADA